jgi:Na+/melibiose symporter-like transporter
LPKIIPFLKPTYYFHISIHALLFYEEKGSSLLLISFFTALARCIEIILKPLIAHWSDNSTFLMGRRKPFMLFGCGFYGLFLVLIFSPPKNNMSAVGTSIWFGIFYVFFFIADTVCNIPYQALGPEMTRDGRQRESLYTTFYFFQYIGVIFSSVAPVLIQKVLTPCECTNCECSLLREEMSLIYTCLFVGIFFVISIILLCKYVVERKDYMNKESTYFVPTLFRLIKNVPFMSLLTPWIIDSTITQIFATMLPFYLQFIINPQNYCKSQNINLNSQVCDVNNWVGLTIFIFFLFCIPFTLIWHWLVKYIGKKKAWQAYSLISIVTFSLFLICDEGMMLLMILISIINSFPAAAGYLNDVFVADCIEYDEFITGKRNEGIYLVFSSFTPKIVGIFAQSLPLTIMSCMFF